VNSTEIAIAAARAASDKKAEDILVIGVSELLVVTDYFVICTGRNDRQVRTIADEVEDQLRTKLGLKPAGREGVDQATWVLLDFVDVVVHVFQPAERDFYRLEKLWSDAPRLDLPEDITGPSSAGAPAAAADTGVARFSNAEDVVESLEAESTFMSRDDGEPASDADGPGGEAD
jgi:ribosome-associated protein